MTSSKNQKIGKIRKSMTSSKNQKIGKSEIGEFLEIEEFWGIGKILEIENARSRKKETTRAFASKREIPSEKSTLVGLKKSIING